MNKTTQDAVKNAETMVKDAQNAFETAYEKFTKSFEELSAMSKDNMDAVMKSAELSGKASEEFGNKVVEISKANFDESVKVAQDLSAAKTVNELVEKQTAFAKTAFETFTKQATALNEAATKNAQDVFAPINARVEAAGEYVKSFQA